MDSHDHSHETACLARDPTNTRRIRERFLRDMRVRFRRIRGVVRRWVGYDEDYFGLAALADGPEAYRFDRNPEKVTKFMEWLRDRLNEGILEPAGPETIRDGGHWTAKYVRSSYGRGWQTAEERLRQEGVEVGQRAAVDVVFDMPVARRQLRKMFTRTYENLSSITSDMANGVRRVLTQGLADGVHPREMADRLTKEIRAMERTRALTLARTEVIESHSTSALDRYDDAGVGTVRHGEWAATDDARTCPICEYLDGREYTTDEMRNGTFYFPADEIDGVPDSLAGNYRLKPPAHPNGRCAILPVVT